MGDLVGGKLRIAERLGQGGMGVVFAGEHLDLRQAVAIKLLQPALAREPDALARFLREARAAASITSRHAVRIHDVGTTDAGVPYMVMERLHGIGVDALLEEKGTLPVEQAVRIIVEAAEAIAEANALGIVHRDVKPSNLFLANDVVKVLDFGISKRVTAEDGHESASLTAPQTLLGSPQYMSPEQLRDPRSVDERTDVWGLGVTLYELLTGHTPFECDSIPELCAMIFNSTPARADAQRPEIPAALAEVIDRCLAKQAAQRTPSVASLVGELLPFCRGEVAAAAERLARTAKPTLKPILSASPPLAASAPTPVVPAVRSRRGALVLGATAASVALGIGIFVTRGGPPSVARRETKADAPSASAASAAAATVDAAPPATEPAPSASASSSAAVPDAAPPSNPATAPKPSAPRARGLKGIKLID